MQQFFHSMHVRVQMPVLAGKGVETSHEDVCGKVAAAAADGAQRKGEENRVLHFALWRVLLPRWTAIYARQTRPSLLRVPMIGFHQACYIADYMDASMRFVIEDRIV